MRPEKEERMFSMSGFNGPAREVFRVSPDRKQVRIFHNTLSSVQALGMCQQLVEFFEGEGRAFDSEGREVVVNG